MFPLGVALAADPVAAPRISLPPPAAAALPVPAARWVVQGTAREAANTANAQGGRNLTIEHSSQRAIYNWQRFDIGAGSGVHFDMRTGANGTALGAVIGEAEPGQQPGEIGETDREARRLRPAPAIQRPHAERDRASVGGGVEFSAAIEEGGQVEHEARGALCVLPPDAEAGRASAREQQGAQRLGEGGGLGVIGEDAAAAAAGGDLRDPAFREARQQHGTGAGGDGGEGRGVLGIPGDG
jgi:hypothetical protein